MIETKVISVNPGVKTFGEMSMSNMSLVRFSRSLSSPGRKVISPFRKTVNAILGINSHVNDQFSGKMMVMRLLFGSVLILLSVCELNGVRLFESGTSVHPLLLLGVGVSLTIGLLGRLVCLAGAGWIFYSVVTGVVAGSLPDLFNVMLALTMTVFGVLGPGRYCIDQFIRRSMYTLSRKYRSNRKKKSPRVTLYYRAYEMAGRNIG